MKISVITAVYNGADTIRHCIESVRMQTHTDVEYIVIDGNSTDGTQQIVQEYMGEGVVDFFVSEKDGGIYNAMNKGIAHATGEIVCILNADDVYKDTDALARIHNVFLDSKVMCAYGDVEYVRDHTEKQVVRVWKSRPYVSGLFRRGWHPPHTAFFVRKSAYDTYGVYREDMKIASDYELMLRFLEKEHLPSVYIPHTLVQMQAGGVSNGSVRAIIRSNIESVRAWRKNNMHAPLLLFFRKPLSKVRQYFAARAEKTTILFVGPLVPPITGQAVAFTKAYECIEGCKKYIVNHNLTGKNVFIKILRTIYSILKIAFILTTKEVDTVYFTCSRTMLGSVRDVVLVFFARAAGTRIVTHLHGADFKSFYHSLPKWYRYLVTFTYNHVEEGIVLLEGMREQFSDFPNIHINVVPNFYNADLEVYKYEKKDTNDEVHILYLSNILATKGIFYLLDAFADLEKQYDNVYLNIAGGFVGDNDMSKKEVEEHFMEKISSMQRVHYLGMVRGDQKKELLHTSDIFVLPSYFSSEALPISAIEAMATGNALILTEHNYLSELKNEVNKIIWTKDSKEIAQAISFFVENKEALHKAKIENIKYAKKYFSEENYIHKLNGILIN